MKYGYYEKSEKDVDKDSKLSTYSETKEKDTYKISQQEQKISSQQNNIKGVSFGNIKNTGEEVSKEASKGAAKSAASAAASKAPSVVVQVIDKAKEGFEKALEYARPAERALEPEENPSRFVPGIICACCTVLALFIVICTIFPAVLPIYSTILLFSGGVKETEIKQVPHTWYPYERNQECSNCTGTGLNLCVDCSGTTVVFCNTCDGDGYTYVVRNKSGSIVTETETYEYRSYRIESGCADCGGSGTRVVYYEKIMGGGIRLIEEDGQTFVSGSKTKECLTCNATGRMDKCISCNGQGVYYMCIHSDCPYHEWNHWESLGVDMDGICFEREVEVTEDD